MVLLVALFFQIFCAAPAAALTASEIITRARVLLRDSSTDTSRQRFSDAQLLNWINDGQREANAVAWILQSSFTFNMTGGTTEYALPTDFQATWRVLFNDKKIEQTSLDRLDADISGWMSVRGPPRNYYVFLASTPVIGFYPVPTSSSTGTVKVYYIQQTADLTSVGQTPFNAWTQSAAFHSALTYYLAYRGWWALGDSEIAGRYFDEWQIYVEAFRKGLLKQPDFNPGFRGGIDKSR